MDTQKLSKFVSFLQTTPLWYGNYDGLEQFDFPHIDLEGFQCSPIPNNLRLGHQMEHVFLQLLESSSRFRVRAYNIPISRDKISLGEIDFILDDLELDRILHVELTYKFYVLDPRFPNLIDQFVGPNKKDTFYAKKEKIKHRQIPLLHSKEGSKVLRDLDIDSKELLHKVCFKAQIFIPLGMDIANLFPFNSQCIAGFWMGMEEFLTYKKTNSQFYIPYKKEWPQRPTPELNWRAYQDVELEMESHLANNNSPMIWMKMSNNEMLKIFVVWWL